MVWAGTPPIRTRLQQGFAIGEMGRRSNCTAAMVSPSCPLWAKCGHLRSLGERGNGGFRDLLAPLLDEVTTIWNLERRGTPAYLLAQCCHHRRSQYRVFHPDGHERLPAPLLPPPLRGPPRDVYALHLGRHHHQLGKSPYARLKARVRKRC